MRAVQLDLQSLFAKQVLPLMLTQLNEPARHATLAQRLTGWEGGGSEA
jgi:hypothetical protein